MTSVEPAKIPDTPERRELDRKRSIRNIVFGVQDGILTTLGTLTALAGAHLALGVLLLAALATALAGTLSMGVGEYLGSKAEKEVVLDAVRKEKREMTHNPQAEHAEQIAFLLQQGFPQDVAESFTDAIAKNPDIWLHEMLRTEYGIDEAEATANPIIPGAIMAIAFAFGALLPVVPYFFTAGICALALSLCFSVIGLYSIGYVAGRFANINPYLKGLELIGWGALLFLITFIAGHFIPVIGA